MTDQTFSGPTVLIIGPAWIGDMVLSQSLYKSLKKNISVPEIHVTAPVWSQALLRRMPEVDAILDWPFSHGELKLSSRYQFGVKLRDRVYTQAIVLPRSIKAALVPWFASIPIRTGYRGEMRYGLLNDIRALDKHTLPRIIDRFVYLGLPRGTISDALMVAAPELTVSIRNRDRCLDKLALSTDKPIVALLPGAAFGKSKQWPLDYFAELAADCLKRDFQVWIFGSQADSVLSKQIMQKLPAAGEVIDLCGKTTLEDVIDLLSVPRLAVSNDSGLMHIAAAVGCPVVAVYGATSPAYTPPMVEKSRIMYRDIECSPCWERKCRYGHYRCLTEIMPAEVSRAVTDLLQQ